MHLATYVAGQYTRRTTYLQMQTMNYQILYTNGRDVSACEYLTARSYMEAWSKGTARAQGHERVLDVVPMTDTYKEFWLTTKSKEWLLLNAIECWLYYCDEKLELTDTYKAMRDEYRALVDAENSKDAPVVERSETPDVPTTPKRTRSRSTKWFTLTRLVYTRWP